MSHASDDGADIGDRVEPGARIGNYVVERFIAAGGMGAVYEARHAELERKVAIKLIRSGLGAAAGIRDRFTREAKTAARVKHPHVVEVTDFGFQQDRPYLVMEYLVGQSLFDRLASGLMEVEEVVRVLVPVAAGLAAAHELGIVHRDIKPENIFLATAEGRRGFTPKLLDFGIAQLSDPSQARLTRAGLIIGTKDYLAPEQVDDRGPIDARVDQYALAVVAYQCLAGRKPIEELGELETLIRIRDGKYPLLSSLRPELPVGLAAIIHRAMAVRRDERYDKIRDFGRALSAYGGPEFAQRWADELGRRQTMVMEPLESPRPLSEPPIPPPPPRHTVVGDTTNNQALLVPPRRPAWGPWVGAAGLALGLGAAVWMGTAESTGPEPAKPAPESSPRVLPPAPSVEPPPPSPARSSTRAETVIVPNVVIDSPAPPPSPSPVLARPSPIKTQPTPTPTCTRKTGANGSISLDCD